MALYHLFGSTFATNEKCSERMKCFSNSVLLSQIFLALSYLGTHCLDKWYYARFPCFHLKRPRIIEFTSCYSVVTPESICRHKTFECKVSTKLGRDSCLDNPQTHMRPVYIKDFLSPSEEPRNIVEMGKSLQKQSREAVVRIYHPTYFHKTHILFHFTFMRKSASAFLL